MYSWKQLSLAFPLPPAIPRPQLTIAGLRRALGDCVLAVSFLLAMLPAGRELSFSLAGAANIVWLTGAAIMAVMSFARFAPRSATVNLRTIAASGAMLILPCFMRPIDRSTGALATIGLDLRVVRRDADPDRASLHGPQLRYIARESWNRIEGPIPMGSSSDIFRMAGAFDRLRDVLRESPQHDPDRCRRFRSWSGESTRKKHI